MYTHLFSLSSDQISSALMFRIPGFRIPAFLLMFLRSSHRLPCTCSLLLPTLPYTLHFLLQYLQPLDPILRIYMYTLLSSLSSDWISSVLLFRIPGFRIPAFLMMCLRLSHRLPCTGSLLLPTWLYTLHFLLQYLQPLDPILRIYMYTLLSSLSSDWISSVLLFRIPGFRIPVFLMMCLRLSHRLLCTGSCSLSMLLCTLHFPLQHSIQVSIHQMCT